MAEQALRRWRAKVPPERVEEAIAVLLEAFPGGLEETSDGFAGYLPATDAAPSLPAWITIASEDVAPGWLDAWRAFHRPVEIGGTWVRPPWLDAPADAVVLEPGRAFGTGSHGSTRAAGELLLAQAPGSLLDLGCGSGLLAILAARAGHGPIVALDVDRLGVEATIANAEVNGVADRIDARLGDALADPLPVADLAVANIERRVVEPLLRRDGLPDRVIAGGLLARDPLDHPGWDPADERGVDGWRAVLLVRRLAP